MSLKKVGLALVAVLVLGAVAANSAMALKAKETNGFWYEAGAKIAKNTPVKCSIGEHPTGEKKFVLNTTFGTNNVPLTLTATGVSCPGGEIFNEKSKAKAKGTILFTGVTVSTPAGCSVVGGEVETNQLTSQVFMEEGSATKVFQRFAPTVVGGNFTEVEIEGCAAAGVYPVKGVVFGESLNATGAEAKVQELTFSKEINETAGGALTFGTKAATLTGKGLFELSNGANWSAKET